MANIIFEKVRIYNFLSFGEAELDFRHKGYVLISGINRSPKDGAISNGSGKSAIFNAVSWALTGETIQGLSSNICNLNFLDKGCWVELTFKIEKDEYIITRYRDFGRRGGDLKILINGEDKSGDGLRKSEALLAEYLPDVTSMLLGSVIILGQGLPHRFTNNTPSGRKELLEILSKSDFMINDIRDKLTKRSIELAQNKRNLEDILLELKTQKTVYLTDLENTKEELLKYQVEPAFDKDILEQETKLKEIDKEYQKINAELITFNKTQVTLNESLIKVVNNKSEELNLINNKYNEEVSKIKLNISKLNSEQTYLTNEINKLKSIKDICPTCGQKIPDVVLQDTSELEEKQLKNNLEKLNLQNQETRLNETNKQEIEKINIKYNSEEIKLRTDLNTTVTTIQDHTNILNNLTTKRNTISETILTLKHSKNTFEHNKKQIQDKIILIQNNINTTKEKALYNDGELNILNSHILAVDKMVSLVRRDFRGYLLTNVIEFINHKAKEYCLYLFDSDEIDISLNGNNIDITFSNKYYENLSGGEKQKVDLIIQFSIRDMLSQYLNFSSNVLVLDEITDNLDSKGSERIINLISNKLIDIESVFIITHHTELLQGLFDSEITVEKDEQGVSRIK